MMPGFVKSVETDNPTQFLRDNGFKYNKKCDSWDAQYLMPMPEYKIFTLVLRCANDTDKIKDFVRSFWQIYQRAILDNYIKSMSDAGNTASIVRLANKLDKSRMIVSVQDDIFKIDDTLTVPGKRIKFAAGNTDFVSEKNYNENIKCGVWLERCDADDV